MDAENAIEAEVFEILSAPDVKAQATVYQHVPENTALEEPLLIIGDMSADGAELATKDGDDEAIELTIVGVVQAEERRPVFDLKKLVKDKLNNHRVDRDGWRLIFAFKGADGFLDPETGAAYVGNYRFKVLAFRAS